MVAILDPYCRLPCCLACLRTTAFTHGHFPTRIQPTPRGPTFSCLHRYRGGAWRDATSQLAGGGLVGRRLRATALTTHYRDTFATPLPSTAFPQPAGKEVTTFSALSRALLYRADDLRCGVAYRIAATIPAPDLTYLATTATCPFRSSPSWWWWWWTWVGAPFALDRRHCYGTCLRAVTYAYPTTPPTTLVV